MNIFVNLIPFSLFPIYLIVCVSVLHESEQLLVNILNFLFNVQLKPELLIKYWGVYRIFTSLIHFLLPPCSPFPPRPALSIICHKLCRFLPFKTYCIQNFHPSFLPSTLPSMDDLNFICRSNISRSLLLFSCLARSLFSIIKGWPDREAWCKGLKGAWMYLWEYVSVCQHAFWGQDMHNIM